MIGIPLGLLYANIGEWLIHKHVLHGLGGKKSSFWAFHWHEHHRASRRNDMLDEAYVKWKPKWDPRNKELVGLIALAGAHLPLLPVMPFFTGTVIYSTVHYYRVHKRSHVDPDWGREHLPWHYDHHMGPNQHANWCVTKPFWDHVMGTREVFIGTQRDRRRRQKQANATQAAAA